jgi:hypothetical protein
MLQAGCRIREVRLWKCSMFLLISLFLEVVVLIINNFTINSYFFFRLLDSCIVTIRTSLKCIGSSKRPEVLLTVIDNPGSTICQDGQILFSLLKIRDLNARVSSRGTVTSSDVDHTFGTGTLHFLNQCQFNYARLLIKSTIKRMNTRTELFGNF